jgi:YHS domain-containing protein
MKLWKVLVIGMLALALLALVGCGKSEEKQPATQQQEEVATKPAVADHTPAGDEIGTETTCPVCGMSVTVDETTPSATYDGNTYYFCSPGDKETFAANPEMFTKKPADTTGQMEEGTGE